MASATCNWFCAASTSACDAAPVCSRRCMASRFRCADIAIGLGFDQSVARGQHLFFGASALHRRKVGLRTLQLRLGAGGLQPGIGIFQLQQQLARLYPLALLHKNLLHRGGHGGVSFKVVQGLDFSVGGNARGDRLPLGMTDPYGHLRTAQRHKCSQHHHRQDQGNKDDPGPLAVHGFMPVLSSNCHFCSSL